MVRLIHEFPEKFGYGFLNPATWRENLNEVSADYYYRDIRVHRITYNKNKNNWEAMDFAYGKGTLSGSKELRRLGETHFRFCKMWENPLFQRLYKDVNDLGNIYFEEPAEKEKGHDIFSFHPQGRVFLFKIPFLRDDSFHERAQKFEDLLLSDNDRRIFFNWEDCYITSILITDKKDVIRNVSVMMIQMVVGLQHVYHVAEYIHSIGVILPEKHFRMVISDVSLNEKSFMREFTGSENDPYKMYQILYKGLGEENFEKLNYLWLKEKNLVDF